MPKTSQRGSRQRPAVGAPPEEQPTAGRQSEDHPIEEEPAVERGERIDTGKTIARGGKETGHVPGATEQPVEVRK
jgi:hypothetical protein